MGTWIGHYWPETIAALATIGVLIIGRLRRLVLRFNRWWYSSTAGWVTKSVPVVAASAAVAVQVVVGNEQMPALAHGALVAALLTAIAVIPPVLEQATAERVADEAIERITHDFNRTLLPLSAAVRDYTEANGGRKSELRGSALVVALAAASSLMGGSDIRAICYHASGSKPARTLRPVHTLGRSDEASRTFDEQTQVGAEVFDYLDARRVRFCRSIEEDPTLGYQASADAPIWKSFVSAPVVVHSDVVGMVTVDSKLERDFNQDEDPYLLQTIANLLAVTWKA
ncbi:hypothetical protein BJ986_000199 [Phycicoccus badiiscoriae]|uniref:GAF domain-containing protein n=1 Tax=Pedococcus badiiscoriae TaxID=642776 RepID=A0A852WK87_9MICO|nr:GAF domain-containing protein [Pedococcus badiiscoriae]NYG05712.1 hypothetical protein [Pedococcus badiiscoriae]